jgi:hypothetical protein
MVTLESFLPLVRGRLPGCPEMILENGVRDACIEFCKRTQFLTEAVTVDVVSGEAAVTLYPDTDTHWEVLSVQRDAELLTPLFRAEFVTQGLDVDSGTPAYYYLEGDRTLVLGPIPDADETLTAVVTLRPKDTATRVADALYSDLREAIAAGARAWVRRNYGDWVNPQFEAEDRKIFEYAIHNQNIRRARGGGSVPLRVRTHSF